MIGDEIRVNGNDYTWGSIIVKIAGERLNGYTEISFSHKRTRSKGYGLGKDQVAKRRGRGKYELEPVKLKGYAASIEALRVFLANEDPSGDATSYGDTEFEITVQLVEDTSNQTPITYVLSRCVITGESSPFTEGTDLLMEEIEIDCMLITKNGRTLAAVS